MTQPKIAILQFLQNYCKFLNNFFTGYPITYYVKRSSLFHHVGLDAPNDTFLWKGCYRYTTLSYGLVVLPVHLEDTQHFQMHDRIAYSLGISQDLFLGGAWEYHLTKFSSLCDFSPELFTDLPGSQLVIMNTVCLAKMRTEWKDSPSNALLHFLHFEMGVCLSKCECK